VVSAGLTFATLLALWLLLSGIYAPLEIGLGVVSCALVVWFGRRLRLRSDRRRWWIALGTPRYAVWLAREIVNSNLHVTRVILTPRMPLLRQVLHIRPSQQSALGVAILANSITLTPGTLTIDAEGGRLEVHALTQPVADDLLSGEMDRRVAVLERPPA